MAAGRRRNVRDMELAGATCSAHSAVAVDTCERCGIFLCAECINFADTSALCVNCHAMRVYTKPSGRAVAALLMGIVGLHCLWPLGVLGWVLASQERAAIDAGKAPVAGQSLTTAAKGLGILNLVVLVGVVLVAAVAFLTTKQRF